MIPGICVQCSSGGHVPIVEQLKRFLPNGGTVRDVLGWHRVEQTKEVYSLPSYAERLYANVAAAGCQNVITLAFGNRLYMKNNMDFPIPPIARDVFVKYAVWVVNNVPNLAAVSIWNEMNGSFGTGSPPQRQSHYATLLAEVVPAIRAANPSVKIIAGATVGWNVDGWFKHLDALYSLKNIDWLDIHPYLGADHLDTFGQQMARIRAAGIMNPAFFTEHGGPNAKAMGSSYWPFFKRICAADSVPVAGHNYFLMQSTDKFHSGLLGMDSQETDLGRSWT